MAAYVSLLPRLSTRQELTETLRTIAADGLAAEPVMIGEDRDPQAVLISLEQYAALADHFDAVSSAEGIRARLEATQAAGGPVEATLADLAAAAGVELPHDGGQRDAPSPG
jgi:PHD/YefM family antitoxin component YafN of YafNO toxin-antitoxin module